MPEKRVVTMGFVTLALVLASAWLSGSVQRNTATPTTSSAHHVNRQGEVVHASSAAQLEELFLQRDYTWPPPDHRNIPPLFLESLPPDLVDVPDVRQKQTLFLRSVLPLVVDENRRLRERRFLAALVWRSPLSATNAPLTAWAQDIAERFGVTLHPRDRERLLSQLDELPVALVLAQAAIETGWGTSRFASEGNSLFGQWTYDSDGLTPIARDADASHRVRTFPNLRASVQAYLHNINTGSAYRELRIMRARMRQHHDPLDAYLLSGALWRYSQRGVKYVADVRRVLRSDVFDELRALSLRHGES